ncbi:MAG: hypothetical protein IKO91_03395 [Oscillospiraceae bacterium]|nr:hypothetical protein [Oscillospiraceae bacterium]
MKPWKTLGWGRRAFYLASAILPLVNIVMHLAMGGFSLYYLIPFTVAALLGLGNLALAVRGRLPRKGLVLWHALLVVSLVIVVYLMQFQIGLIVWLTSAD